MAVASKICFWGFHPGRISGFSDCDRENSDEIVRKLKKQAIPAKTLSASVYLFMFLHLLSFEFLPNRQEVNFKLLRHRVVVVTEMIHIKDPQGKLGCISYFFN